MHPVNATPLCSAWRTRICYMPLMYAQGEGLPPKRDDDSVSLFVVCSFFAISLFVGVVVYNRMKNK